MTVPDGPTAGFQEPPLAGRRLYSPGVIAAYTVLANLPTGCILYGLNLRARGERRFGLTVLLVGVLLACAEISLTAFGPAPSRVALIGIASAICLYRIESGPYEKALKMGALRARWWPPALVLLAVLACLFVVAITLAPAV